MSFVDFLLDYASDWIELVKYLPKHLLNHLVITIATHMLAYLMIKMRIIRFTIQTICISEVHLFSSCLTVFWIGEIWSSTCQLTPMHTGIYVSSHLEGTTLTPTQSILVNVIFLFPGGFWF
jgi:hypothetical protein